MTETQRESFFTPSEPAMYCDRLRCGNEGEKPPLVLVHGAGHNGACYLQTPDGRPGWAQYFAQAGYDVYVPDWPGMGRSGRMEPSRLTGGIVAAALGVLLERLGRPAALLTHSMSGAYGWKVREISSPSPKFWRRATITSWSGGARSSGGWISTGRVCLKTV